MAEDQYIARKGEPCLERTRCLKHDETLERRVFEQRFRVVNVAHVGELSESRQTVVSWFPLTTNLKDDYAPLPDRSSLPPKSPSWTALDLHCRLS